MPFQFLDLVLAACAALGQILSGVDGGMVPMLPHTTGRVTVQVVQGGVDRDIAATLPPPIYPIFITAVQLSDGDERLEVLLNQSEDLRQMQAEWRRFWMQGCLTWGWHYRPVMLPCQDQATPTKTNETCQRVDGGIELDQSPHTDTKSSSDANERLDVLMNDSFDSSPVGWKGILTWGWHYTLETRPSSQMTYQRVDGGIGP